MDVFLGENFDAQLDDRKDLAMVDGDRELEQQIAVLLAAYFYLEIGSVTATNAAENLQLEADRILDEVGGLDALADMQVEKDDGDLMVTIIYDTGETTTRDII